MRKALKKLKDVLDDFGMFLLTALCAFLSSYVPAYKAGTEIHIDFSLGRMIIALLLAVLITGIFELRGMIGNKKIIESLDKVEHDFQLKRIRQAKRKNVWLRLVTSIAMGFAATKLLELAQSLLGL